MHTSTFCGFAALAAMAAAQTQPATVLEIESENYVVYYDDVGDRSKLGTSAAMAPVAPNFNWVFKWFVGIGDIVAVNGKPAKGLRISRGMPPRYTTQYTPGRATADLSGNCLSDWDYAFLQADGTPIGAIALHGFGGTSRFAGTGHISVVGGTGPFVGARGYMGAGGRTILPSRSASMVEDPANRRLHGGGRMTEVIHVIPMTRPEVLMLQDGPAIYHADSSMLVTAENPARAGELLTIQAAHLGPTEPGVVPGQPFPPWEPGRVHRVNSPVEVTLNGKAAQIINAIGWPGLADVYRLDFQVPEGTPVGSASLMLSVAWIDGPEVKIPIR